ncbi:MAG: DinB family protein [Phycisphaerales bacterium]
MSGLVARFQRVQAYERECGRAVLTSLASVAASRRTEPSICRAMALAAHIQAARLLWLHRLTGTGERPEAVFFDTMTLGEVERMTAEADEAWRSYADELTESELGRVARYANLQGQPHECAVADVLTHVVNHASYHRGQIAMLVRQAGGTPAVTDFIFFAYREPEGA